MHKTYLTYLALVGVNLVYASTSIFTKMTSQQEDLTACSWYEKNGYEVASVTDIYYWWIH